MSNSIVPAAETALTAENTTVVEANAKSDAIDATKSSTDVTVVTDAELIAVAKNLNASAQSLLKKSIEEFWRLGEALARLQERPSLKGRWREVLKEIGLNHTSANHAQRFHAATSLEKLAGYQNKTAALRALGILSEANQAKKETPDRSSKATAKAAPGGLSLTKILAEQRTNAPPADFASNIVDITAGSKAEEITTGADAEEGTAREEKAEVSRPEPAPIPAETTLDPLTRITRIVYKLEYLAADEFDLTAEFVAQIELARKALDLILRKGAFHAAA